MVTHKDRATGKHEVSSAITYYWLPILSFEKHIKLNFRSILQTIWALFMLLSRQPHIRHELKNWVTYTTGQFWSNVDDWLISRAWYIFDSSPAFLNYKTIFGPFFRCTKYQSSRAGSDIVPNLRSFTKKHMPHPHAALSHTSCVLSGLTSRKAVLSYKTISKADVSFYFKRHFK
jgi:hypothetical protein